MREVGAAGDKYGELKLLKRVANYISPGGQSHAQWKCKCSCGKKVVVRLSSLRSGLTKSCEHDKAKHGLSFHPLFAIWWAIKERTTNPKNRMYKRYGGRGIKMYSGWLNNFESFFKWIAKNLGSKPSEDHSLDRPDNDGDYEPNNLRWATKIQQNRNRSSTRYVLYKGKMRKLRKLAVNFGIDLRVVRSRIDQLNWTVEKALTTPVRNLI